MGARVGFWMALCLAWSVGVGAVVTGEIGAGDSTWSTVAAGMGSSEG